MRKLRGADPGVHAQMGNGGGALRGAGGGGRRSNSWHARLAGQLQLTFEALAHAQGQSVLGPLHDAGVVEQHTRQHGTLPGHHGLVGWLLAEAGLGPWQSQSRHYVR